ncbi:MAG: peptidoglycan D,D-transpeptidase FtsI family protein [Patescibacteria group bacterium]
MDSRKFGLKPAKSGSISSGVSPGGASPAGASSSGYRSFSRKISSIMIIFVIISLVLGFKLFNIQISQNSKYTIQAAQENNFSTTIPSLRGLITASNGLVLADNVPIYDAYVTIKNITNRNNFVSEVTKELGLPQQQIWNLINLKLIWVRIASNVTTKEKNKLSNLTSLSFIQNEQRSYPNGSLFAHVLGFLGKDRSGNISGFYGIEGYFNGALTGHSGYTQGIESALGIPLLNKNYKFIPPQNGDTINLTLNPAIQNIVSSDIQYWSKKEDATSGAAIVMNPKTGAIIAMSSYPSFNPNTYWKYQYSDYLNNAISFIYEPGSVGKLIMAAAALSSGKVTPQTTVDDKTGRFVVGGKTIYNWNKAPDGVMNLGQILFQSSNVGASIIATKYLSSQIMYNESKNFGFGSLTGITLQGEETGIIPPYQTWNESNLATDSFGQFVSVSPLQIIDAYAAVANGGVRMQPYVVNSITTPDGKTVVYHPTVVNRPITPTVASQLNSMFTYTTGGEPNWALHQTGVGAYMPIIAGKTGSAQMPSVKHPGQYSTHNYVMTYVAYAPANNPKFILLTMMNSPHKPLLGQYYAATTACVEWGAIAKQLFQYYGIAP